MWPSPPMHYRFTRKLFWHVDHLVDWCLYIFFCPSHSNLHKAFSVEGLSFFTELSFLHSAAGAGRHTDGVIVEIGSYRGRSAVAMALALSPVDAPELYAVDPLPPDTQEVFLGNVRNAGVEDRVTPLFLTSLEASKNWDKKVRLMFIDGDHSYEGVKTDFQAWKSFIPEGGLLAFHDSYYPGVKKLLREMEEEMEFIFLGKVASISCFSKRRKEVNSLRRYFQINKFRQILATLSNSAKRLFKIDNAKWS